MAIYTTKPKVITIRNIALEAYLRSDSHKIAPFTLNNEFSFEMARFLTIYEMEGLSTKHYSMDRARALEQIANRKSCYKEPIFNQLGLFNPSSLPVLKDAKILFRAFESEWSRLHQRLPKADELAKMDDIILYGELPLYSIRILKFLWEMLPEETRQPKRFSYTATGVRWSTEVVKYDQRDVIPLAAIRNNIHARNGAEKLIKFGLVDLLTIHKEGIRPGRGRSPVGISINDMGRRFYLDYLANFDQKTKLMLTIEQEYEKIEKEPENGESEQRPENPVDISILTESVMSNMSESSDSPDDEPVWPKPPTQSSDNPDIVDGENLRELFS